MISAQEKSLSQQIAQLRASCSFYPSESTDHHAIHKALAEALLQYAEITQDGAGQRSSLLAAAKAWEEAGYHQQAGEIYEKLGLLRQAALAYEHAGAIEALEYIHALLEQQKQEQESRRMTSQHIHEALQMGQRRFAQSLLFDQLSQAKSSPASSFVSISEHLTSQSSFHQQLHALESRFPLRSFVELQNDNSELLRIYAATHFHIGRSAHADLCIANPELSRQHISLYLQKSTHSLVAFDYGSRSGSFWCGEALVPGEETLLDQPGSLTLGMATTIEIFPLQFNSNTVGGLIHVLDSPVWSLFLPAGGPLMFRPHETLPVFIRFRPPFLEISGDASIRLSLNGFPIQPTLQVELLPGDRVEFQLANRSRKNLHILS